MPISRFLLSVVLMGVVTVRVYAEDPAGVVLHEPGAFEGYNLYSPLDGVGSYLLDNDGRVVHFWDTDYRSNVGYLLDNGHLLRTTTYGNVLINAWERKSAEQYRIPRASLRYGSSCVCRKENDARVGIDRILERASRQDAAHTRIGRRKIKG